MPLTCLKVSLKTDDLKLLHECISKIVAGNIELEKAGKELFYGYLPPLPPLEETYKIFTEEPYYNFLFTHPIFGYYLFFETDNPSTPIGFIALGLSGSSIPGFVNKSTHFVLNQIGKGYGKEAFKIILEIIQPFIGKNIKLNLWSEPTQFRGISASVNIKNTASLLMNARQMTLYDYKERLQTRHSIMIDNEDGQAWLSHGLYFYYTTLAMEKPKQKGSLDLNLASYFLNTMMQLDGAKRLEENKRFQETHTLLLLSKSAKEKTTACIADGLKPVMPDITIEVSKDKSQDVQVIPNTLTKISEIIAEYTGPAFRY